MKFHVLTYNIHKGLDRGNRRFILPELRSAVSGLSPDIVCAQEVLGAHLLKRTFVQRWQNVPQADFLAEQWGGCSAYGPNAAYPHGHHGNAVLSRFALSDVENTDVSINRFEKRGILRCRLELPDGMLLFCFCVHFDLHSKTREQQFQRVSEEVIEHTSPADPVIVCGDFNDVRKRASRYLKNAGLIEAHSTWHGRYGATFPSALPMFPLDRIYYRGLELLDVSVQQGRPWKRLSDHCPVSAVFREV